MKTICYSIVVTLAIALQLRSQPRPRLLMGPNDFSTVKARWSSKYAGYVRWNSAILASARSDIPSGTQVPGQDTDQRAAEYDRMVSIIAKNAAFQFYMQYDATAPDFSMGDKAYSLITNPQNPFVANYQVPQGFDRFMIDALALINYCEAYDILCSTNTDLNPVNYFVARYGAVDGVSKQAQAGTILKNRLMALWNKVHSPISGSGIVSSLSDIMSGGSVINNENLQKYLFRYELNNMRIIVAAAMGVGAITFWSESDVTYSDWLSFANADISYILFGNTVTSYDVSLSFNKLDVCTGVNNNYAYKIVNQYCDGMFGDGPGYFNYAATAFIPFFLANSNFSQTLGGASINFLSEPKLIKYFDWFEQFQTPSGNMPWFNSSDYDVYSLAGILSSKLQKPTYRYQMENNSPAGSAYYSNGLDAEALAGR